MRGGGGSSDLLPGRLHCGAVVCIPCKGKGNFVYLKRNWQIGSQLATVACIVGAVGCIQRSQLATESGPGCILVDQCRHGGRGERGRLPGRTLLHRLFTGLICGLPVLVLRHVQPAVRLPAGALSSVTPLIARDGDVLYNRVHVVCLQDRPVARTRSITHTPTKMTTPCACDSRLRTTFPWPRLQNCGDRQCSRSGVGQLGRRICAAAHAAAAQGDTAGISGVGCPTLAESWAAGRLMHLGLQGHPQLLMLLLLAQGVPTACTSLPPTLVGCRAWSAASRSSLPGAPATLWWGGCKSQWACR